VNDRLEKGRSYLRVRQGTAMAPWTAGSAGASLRVATVGVHPGQYGRRGGSRGATM
jgi:hypothetical protein